MIFRIYKEKYNITSIIIIIISVDTEARDMIENMMIDILSTKRDGC